MLTVTANIRRATTAEDVGLARELFVEYVRWLKVDLCFQGIDHELATLPGAYAPPTGRLLLAGELQQAFGCIALRPFSSPRGVGVVASALGVVAATSSATLIGEVKRLYVQPAKQGDGWARRLAEAIIADARSIGYTSLKLDTLDWMTGARKLYAKLGFRECAPYYDNPTPGVVYMVLEL